jgi:hypothetical protein
VADKRYKLIRFYGVDVPNGEEWEFYDLETDPSEMNNTYNNPENAGKIAELKRELDRLKTYYKVPAEPLPQTGSKPDGPQKGGKRKNS